MKKLYIMTVISALAIITVEGFCSPVLVSVELPTIESKKAWHQLDIPTYELLGNTAIAVAEENLIGSLMQKGYQISIIDRQPDMSKYVIVSNTDRGPELKGNSIWQKDKTAILKPASKDSMPQKKYTHSARAMNIRPLGDRFWKSVTTKYVPLKSIPYDPFIQSLVDQVNADSIASYIQRLQDFYTRMTFSDSSYAASEWISNKFMEWGLNAELDSVYINLGTIGHGWGRSAVGKIPGSASKTIITCGHMDTSEPVSPGADDDASGVAGAMEIARIFSKYSWEATLKFAGWEGEETGGWGSNHYAISADSSGESIIGLINMDMLGYMNDSIMNGEVWHYYGCSTWLAELFVDVGETYVPAINYNPLINSTPCDQIYFEFLGFPAITAIEADPYSNPYIHSAHDSLRYLSPAMYVAFVQTSLATMAYLSQTAATIESLEVYDPGNGNQLLVDWAENKEPYVTQYRLYWGKQSEIYLDSVTIDSTCYTISGLMEDTTYYFCARAITQTGYISVVAREVEGTPRVNPIMPSGVSVTPMIMSIKLNWMRSNELDLAGYRVFRKIEGAEWDSLNSAFIIDPTTYIDSVSDKEAKYWYRLRSYDNDGNVSSYTDSVYAYTYIAAGLKATPMNNSITLEWPKNNTIEIDGYLLYRRVNSGSYDSLNQVSFADTFYSDSPLAGEDKYYYRFCAFTNAGLYSRMSDSVYARPITLDQGILLIDETYNWTTGSWPGDAQQDSFYSHIMQGYDVTPYDYISSLQKPILADLCPFSTVVWFADDYSQFIASNCITDMQAYLKVGGKLWFAGWKPVADIRNNNIIYPVDFTSGSFLYDNMLLSHAELSGTSDSFKTATGLKGYPDINVDTLKYPSTIWGKTLRYIEALTPTGTSDTIYVIDMKNDGSAFEGRACAVRDSGKTVFFGFPLYFMDKEQAKLAAQKVMTEFGEPYGVSTERTGDDNQKPVFRLYQNAPNPFSKQTTIKYQLSNNGHVSLRVYNIAGQMVKTLVNEVQQAGSYAISWDGRDGDNRQASNGIYFYCLQSSTANKTSRMVLIR